MFDVIYCFGDSESLGSALMKEDLLVFDVIYCLDG